MPCYDFLHFLYHFVPLKFGMAWRSGSSVWTSSSKECAYVKHQLLSWVVRVYELKCCCLWFSFSSSVQLGVLEILRHQGRQEPRKRGQRCRPHNQHAIARS